MACSKLNNSGEARDKVDQGKGSVFVIIHELNPLQGHLSLKTEIFL